MTLSRVLFAFSLAVVLSGCSLLGRGGAKDLVAEGAPMVHPTDSVHPDRPANDGSLYNPRTAVSPWADDVARAVGDVVTVRVSVDNKGQHSATTDLSRESKMDVNLTSFLGQENLIPGYQAAAGASGAAPGTPVQLIKSDSLSTFAGEGDTQRSGKLTADVSALVTQVFPNGNMCIHGSQSLLVNLEDSILTVDGIVRPSDVSYDNVVSSDRIANARIEITGQGVVSDKQRPGIFMRMFDWLWPL